MLGIPVKRSQSGSVGSTLMLSLIPIAFLFGAVAIDLAHVCLVHNELQNATDAAALAGAQSLLLSPLNVGNHARAIAQNNIADGKSVSSSSPGTTVTVDIVPAVVGTTGMVRVGASMVVNHVLCPMFGRPSDTITATSVAATSGSLKRSTDGQLFPIAIAVADYPDGGGLIDEVVEQVEAVTENGNSGNSNGNGNDGSNGNGNDGSNGNGGGGTTGTTIPRLDQLHPGDLIQLHLNSQEHKNVAFTTFDDPSASANDVYDMIDQSLGLEPRVAGTIPPVEVGDYINLSNGVLGGQRLASSPYYEALLSAPLVMLPVIAGDPAYNQTRQVIGFITLQVTGITLHQGSGIVETISGTLIKAVVPGRGMGASDPGLATGTLPELSPGPIKLVSRSRFIL